MKPKEQNNDNTTTLEILLSSYQCLRLEILAVFAKGAEKWNIIIIAIIIMDKAIQMIK